MEKNPETCKNSINFDGIYVCRLELLTCAMVKGCAIDKLDAMGKAMAEMMKIRRKKNTANEPEEEGGEQHEDWDDGSDAGDESED